MISNRFVTDRQDVSDSPNYNRVISASASDTVAIIDTIQKLLTMNRSERQDVSDIAAKTFLKFVTDNEAVSDAATISLIQALLSISLADTQHMSDGIMKSLRLGRPEDQAASDATRREFKRVPSSHQQAPSPPPYSPQTGAPGRECRSRP